uniref:Uncharacterized protein n=1 Tax=Arundo donax TaxID=35708 RepID=A0A0A9F439_ARUDO
MEADISHFDKQIARNIAVDIPGLVSANETVILQRVVPARGAAADGDEPPLADVALALRLPHLRLQLQLVSSLASMQIKIVMKHSTHHDPHMSILVPQYTRAN